MSNDFFDQRLSSLRAELRSYGQDIIQHVTALYGTKNAPSTQIDLKNDPFNMLSVLQIDVADIIEESQQRTEYRVQHAAELEECNQLVKILSSVASVMDKINTCEDLINKVSLVPACKIVKEISEALVHLPGPNTEIGSGKVCAILRKEKKLLASRLNSKIRRILNECIQFEHGRITVHRRVSGLLRSEDQIIEDEEVTLSSIWEALAASNCTDDAVEDILRSVWLYILQPLWKEKKQQAPRISTATPDNAKSASASATNGAANCVSELAFDTIVREQSRSFDPTAVATFGEGGWSSQRRGHATTIPTTIGGVGAVGSGVAFPALGVCRMPLPQLVTSLDQVFSFLWSEVFCGDAKASESACAKLGSAPAALMETLLHSVAAHLPKCEAELGAFRRSLEGPCAAFEQSLHTFGLIEDTTTQSSGVGAGPLTAYLADLPATYADLRRREILKNARDLVMSDYHNTMLAAGDAAEDELASAGHVGDPSAMLDQSGSYALQKLKFDSCQVSLAACRVLKLVHDVMTQACVASPRVAQVLFQSARDCLEIFLAIVPMQFADVIDTVPRMGAVFYNDCLYIAHNCTLITHKYRQEIGKIDELLLESVGFVDFIPRFRSCGEHCMALHLDEQRATLRELVRRIHINPLGNDADGGGGRGGGGTSAAEKENLSGGGGVSLLGGGLQMAADRLRSQIGSLRNVATATAAGIRGSNNPADFGSAAGRAAGSGTLANDEDGAAAVKRHLERLSSQWAGVLQEGTYSKLLGHLLDGVLVQAMAPLLSTDCIAEAAGAEINRVFRSLQQTRLIFPNEGKDDLSMLRICSSWKRFVGLTDLLEYSLSELAEWLPRKKFSFFTGAEMAQLVRALFEDTPRRKHVLASILEMSS